LRQWLIDKYGDLTKAAENLDMKLSGLSVYYSKGNNFRRPGMDFFVKLLNEGCDLNWLLSEQQNIVAEKRVEYSTKIYDLKSEIAELKRRLKKISDISDTP